MKHSLSAPLQIVFSRTCLACALLLCLAWVCPARAAGPEYEQSRPFQGLVRRDMAQSAARAAAGLDAMDNAMRFLAREPALRFINERNKNTLETPPDLPGLARMLYAVRITDLPPQGFPPAMEAVALGRLIPPEGPLHRAISEALSRPAAIQIHSLILQRQKALLAAYDSRSTALLPLDPDAGGKKMEIQAVRGILDKLRAIEIYLSLLPLRQEIWAEPQATRETMLRAHALDPESPFVLVALAELCLQLDHPAEALEYAATAIRLSPHLSSAHDVKGAILLRQQLPALAAVAFGQAIALEPRDPRPYAHRAAAFLIQEEPDAMCADFRSACALGDCSGYQWATSSGKCPEQMDDATDAPIQEKRPE